LATTDYNTFLKIQGRHKSISFNVKRATISIDGGNISYDIDKGLYFKCWVHSNAALCFPKDGHKFVIIDDKAIDLIIRNLCTGRDINEGLTYIHDLQEEEQKR
jgi:hypothetical protein